MKHDKHHEEQQNEALKLAVLALVALASQAGNADALNHAKAAIDLLAADDAEKDDAS